MNLKIKNQETLARRSSIDRSGAFCYYFTILHKNKVPNIKHKNSFYR